MSKIAIVSISKFPNGNAGAVRQYALGKMFNEIGITPIFFGMGKSTFFKFQLYNNFKYISYRSIKNTFLHKFIHYLLFGLSFIRTLKKEKIKLKYCLIVKVPILAFLQIKIYCKKNNIILLHDSVEWYSKSQFKFPMLSASYISNNLYHNFLINKDFIVIAISRYLYDYYEKKGNITVNIPAVLDVTNISYNIRTAIKNEISITYAGTISNKDKLDTFINALIKFSSMKAHLIKFNVLGYSISEFSNISSISKITLEEHKDIVKFFGRVSRNEVLNVIKESCFTILIRPINERYAKAGFPTKVVESLACGTPVITNESSDLYLYLRDDVDSVILDNDDEISLLNALERINNYDHNKLELMKKEARINAEKNFNYANYCNKMRKLLLNGENDDTD